MEDFEKFIENIERKMPEIMSTKDLINLGMFKSRATWTNMRKRNQGPEYLIFNNKMIVYPKECVLKWLREKRNERNI